MAKIYGLFGAMSGKVADVVMSVRNGQQIVRKYQPNVANPKTQSQSGTRARFKLLSQLAAVMAPVIAIPRTGNVSTRNRFTSINFPLSSFDNNEASITLTGVQLTKSVVALPGIIATRSGGGLNAHLGTAAVDVNRVVYAVFTKTNNELRLVDSKVATAVGTSDPWGVNFNDVPSTEEMVVYAYGVRDNTDSARLAFGNLTAVTGESVANLIVSRSLTENDVTLTETVAAVVTAPSGAKIEDENENKKKK